MTYVFFTRYGQWDRGVRRGGEPPAPLRGPLWGGLMGGFTRTKRLRKELKSILIHNNTLQSFVWSSIALKIHVFHFENWIFFCGFSTKVTRAFLASETMEKVSKVHLTCHSVNGGSLEITHLSVITSYRKKYLKSHFCPELRVSF